MRDILPQSEKLIAAGLQWAKGATTETEAAKHLEIAWRERMYSQQYSLDRLEALLMCYKEGAELLEQLGPGYGDIASEIAQLSECFDALVAAELTGGIFLASGVNTFGAPWYSLRSFAPRQEFNPRHCADFEVSTPIIGVSERGNVMRFSIGRTAHIAARGDATPLDMLSRRAVVAQIPLPWRGLFDQKGELANRSRIASLVIGRESVDEWLASAHITEADTDFAALVTGTLDT